MLRTRIALKVDRITIDFIETTELFSDGSVEAVVYYFRNEDTASLFA